MCKLNKELLYNYSDGTIEPLEKIIVEEHLKYCSECREELREIQEFDTCLENFDFEDIEIPDKLSSLSELIAENCINEAERNDSKLQYCNYNEGMQLIKETAKKGYKLRYNNPYNKTIRKNVDGSFKIVKKAAKKYCENKFKKSRFSKSTLYKILKAV